VVSNAGNQLVGEALYLRKPFLALPETGNFEQAINAHFLRASGGGDWVPFERLTAADLNRFLDQVPAYRRRIRWQEVVGNDAALAAIREELAAVRPLATNVPACQAA
jgi:UDP:flavonoid glycosyltransferase YjiC (YdhE family)